MSGNNSLSHLRLQYYKYPNKFPIPAYDSLAITYVAAGNGVGEIETVVYKNNGATVATLTITYNASNEISTVSVS